MPYKDPTNEHVKRVTDSINRRFIAHTDMLGSTNAINSRNPSVEPQGSSLLGHGRVIGGGEGCAHWSASSANKHYEKSDGLTGSAILGLQDGTIAGDMSKPKVSQTKYKSQHEDDGKFGSLGDSLNARLDAVPLGPTASNARSGYAHKDDSPLETQDVATAKRLGMGRKKKVAHAAKLEVSVVECTCPRLKSGKAPKRCKCGAKVGGSGFAAGTHMDTGFGETLGITSHPPIKRGAGRPRKSGGAVLGLVKAPVAGKLDHMPPTYGNVVVAPQSTSKKSLDRPTTKADMPSSTLSGLGKSGGKRSARAEIVKKVMKERGVKLMEASSIVKKEGLYKP